MAGSEDHRNRWGGAFCAEAEPFSRVEDFGNLPYDTPRCDTGDEYASSQP